MPPTLVLFWKTNSTTEATAPNDDSHHTSPRLQAPELFGAGHFDGKLADMWSVGMVSLFRKLGTNNRANVGDRQTVPTLVHTGLRVGDRVLGASTVPFSVLNASTGLPTLVLSTDEPCITFELFNCTRRWDSME